MSQKRVNIADEDLVRRIQMQADKDRRSFTQQAIVMLEEACDAREREAGQ